MLWDRASESMVCGPEYSLDRAKLESLLAHCQSLANRTKMRTLDFLDTML